jgi:phenylpropionate dioxygenase-like ring-hydroxylating dioxygenase large terminal subunit
LTLRYRLFVAHESEIADVGDFVTTTLFGKSAHAR